MGAEALLMGRDNLVDEKWLLVMESIEPSTGGD
jgi:hypothetical protein